MKKPEGHETLGKKIDECIVHRAGDVRKDITAILAQGLTVDDDNEPAPENIPPPNIRNEIDKSAGLFGGQQWKWNDICQSKATTQKKEASGA